MSAARRRGLLCLLPLFLLISIWINDRFERARVLSGDRLGRYGKPFQMFKFRSMRADADKVGALIYSG